ncbi:hypothetical protein DF057_31795 [Burkholderia cepacia]|nr:hypothetical protein DF057_31795 [Burkholderia cepacia]
MASSDWFWAAGRSWLTVVELKATLELFDIGHSFDQNVKRVWNRRILAAGGTKRHRTSLCL